MDNNVTSQDLRPEWMKIISRYNFPDNAKSWWQIVNSLGMYIVMWVAMVFALKVSFWLMLPLAVIAAGFMVRTFIIFHDCGHGSFFKSKRLNTVVGIITGLIVFTPYHMWTYEHKIHHQTVGNLDKRGIGDVMTLTVDEYVHMPWWKRLGYRIYRNPIILFIIAPLLIFLVFQRFPRKYQSVREKLYLHLSTLVLAVAVALLILLMGWKTFVVIQLTVLFIGAAHGVWLFYVQHQYRHVQWTSSKDWDYKSIALGGSSMFKLPFILNWFTGNIGYHHIHHLSPLVPNYKLKKCHNENELFHEVKPLTFFSAFESLFLRLWDEKRQMLVKFSEI